MNKLHWIEVEILAPNDEIEIRLAEIQDQLCVLDEDIDKLTNHADKIDYLTAVTCGLITGLIDIVFVGKWDFATAKQKANIDVNNKVIGFAKKDPLYIDWCYKHGKDENRLPSAIQYLESKYKLPGDGQYKGLGDTLGVTNATHHLDDFCHHPTLVGLVCCVLVQFSGETKYRGVKGVSDNIPVIVNEYGNFVSENTWGKVFSGVINWFFEVAKTVQNRQGHLMSDIAGSFTSSKKGHDGAGLPGSLMSTLKELASLPCFKDTAFSENLRKAYQNGIGTPKGVDLKVFNALFEGASSDFDVRTEMAVRSELKRQAVPVIINEILVRGIYFIRRFIQEMKEKESILDIEWNKLIPIGNRTIERMMTIASGTFMAVDTLDAVIEGAINSGGNWVGFGKELVLRLNFVGIGRFTIALGTDAVMGFRKHKKNKQRMLLKNETLYLMNVKIYQGEALIWQATKDANESIDAFYDAMGRIVPTMISDLNDMKQSAIEITAVDTDKIAEKNPGLLADILDEL